MKKKIDSKTDDGPFTFTINQHDGYVTIVSDDGRLDIKQPPSEQVTGLLGGSSCKKFFGKIRGAFIEVIREVQ